MTTTATFFRVINLNGNHLDVNARDISRAFRVIEKRHPRITRADAIAYSDMSENGSLDVIHVKAGFKWYAIIECTAHKEV